MSEDRFVGRTIDVGAFFSFTAVPAFWELFVDLVRNLCDV